MRILIKERERWSHGASRGLCRSSSWARGGGDSELQPLPLGSRLGLSFTRRVWLSEVCSRRKCGPSPAVAGAAARAGVSRRVLAITRAGSVRVQRALILDTSF